MTKGQRVVLKLKPDYSFAQKDCKYMPPSGHAADADFVHDLQLVNLYPARGIKLADEDGHIIKRSLNEPVSWETPRAPFEVIIVVLATTSECSLRILQHAEKQQILQGA